MRDAQVRTASCGATACVNTFGDEQLAVDLLADKLLFEALKYSVSAPLILAQHVVMHEGRASPVSDTCLW